MTFERGEVQTPAFMPVGTYGTVKGMTPEDVRATGAHILLGNTFTFGYDPVPISFRCTAISMTSWDGRSNSHGFGRLQVFSLGDVRKIEEEGVTFKSPVNGDKVFLNLRSRCRFSVTWVATLS